MASNDISQDVDDFLRFTGHERSDANNTVFILVLGMTGSGKSTLIQHCTGRDVEIGHSLRSCTNDISVHSFFYNGYHVHLIDTPGFDDTNRSDIDTLKVISSYLGASFANGIRISGIIYLHRISDNRVGNTSFRNLRMFKKLSGASTWPNTVIGTTMWQSDQYDIGEQREKELVGNANWFHEMTSHGARVFRIAEHGTGVEEQRQSGLRIISHLLQRIKSVPTIELQIQRELVLDKKDLDATAAGQETLGDLYHLRSKLTRQLQDAQQHMHEALASRDAGHAQQLRDLEHDCARRIKTVRKEQGKLKTSLIDMHDEERMRVERILADMESKQQAALAKKHQELEEMQESLRLMQEQAAIDAERMEMLKREKAAEDAARREKLLHQQAALDIAKREALRREEAAIEKLRREKRRLEDEARKKKQRMRDEMDRECKQTIAALKSDVAKERNQLQSIGRAKGVMQQNVVNGAANGATAGLTTAVATTLLAGLMCVVS